MRPRGKGASAKAALDLPARVVFLATVLFSGCYASRVEPVGQLTPEQRVMLTGDDEVTLRQTRVEAPQRTLESTAVRVIGKLESVRGDTLVFRKVRLSGGSSFDPLWRADLGAFVVLSENPGLQPETLRIRPLRSVVAFGVVSALVFVGLIVAGGGFCHRIDGSSDRRRQGGEDARGHDHVRRSGDGRAKLTRAAARAPKRAMPRSSA